MKQRTPWFVAACGGALLVVACGGGGSNPQTPSASEDANKRPRPGVSPPAPPSAAYADNLALIRAATVRNRNADNSKFATTPMAKIPAGPTSELLGPREAYLKGDDGQPGNPGGNPELTFPDVGVGTFRIACEFSHFAYDDPLVHPGKPGAAHLHMFWGNTDVNAFSTYDTLYNSGSSTCNGAELNRTGYWAPAMFDAQGNVRVPERVIVYYKGYGLANGNSQVYPPRAAMIIDDRVHRTSVYAGGAIGEPNFICSDQFRGPRSPAALTIPECNPGNSTADPNRATLEMHVKFANCWNRQDPSMPDNWQLPRQGGWFYSDCQDWVTTPNVHYIIQYPLEPGENTAGWYLASDVDPETRTRSKAGGASVHADWWGGWNPGINQQWIDNCVNFKSDTPHGCGFGYLSNAGPDDNNPWPGPALKLRPQYTGPSKVAAAELYTQLCKAGSALTSPEQAAYCTPGAAHKH